MHNPLSTSLLGVTLANPVIAASGAFGFGREYADIIDVSRLGGISGKGLTLKKSPGNEGIRIWETPAGMLNSIGLENPGVLHFVEEECAYMRSLGPAVIANLSGHSEAEYVEGARCLNDADIDILELNISCPNVKAGGMAFGLLPSTAADLTAAVKQVTRHPLLVKLSPNAHDLVAVSKAVEQAGADGLTVANTFLGMAVDVNTRKAVFNNTYAGLSGPAIFPIALRMVHQVAHAVSIPVVGCGGIATANDALSMLMAGAAAVQVGAMQLADPATLIRIIDDLMVYCEESKLNNISEICGIL
ncbi:MAG: dihydroorotate dehydrogenase [Eubacteriales bacterium]|nr:dihydroorotate dehydrogenase [Eubacteriales bacterium]